MIVRKAFLGLFGVALFAGMCTAVSADIAEDARKVAAANDSAVVTVRIVVETTTSYQGESEKEENKASATGTVVDPSGLVVTSLTAINPRDRFSEMMESDEDFKMSTRAVDIKIRLADGTEIPSDVVLRDRDLDLAFIRPKKAPEKPLAFLDVSSSASSQMMDEVIVLYRLGQVGSRALAASVHRIAAVVTKPRLSYVLADGLSYNLGYPTFSADGKPIGLLVLRANMSKDSDGDISSTMDNMLPVVLPYSALTNAIAQAKTATPEKQAEEPTAKPSTQQPDKPSATKPAQKPKAKPATK